MSKEEANQLAYGVKDAVRILGISRSLLYQEMKAGRIKSVKVGRRTLIRRVDAEAWLEQKANENY
ncbi:helix-turn-helix domain-containing protein [Spiribacter sp. 218]|uniref:helix-turn-helix domain-containing protein n=1 Tax=Spiribacter pallidus TaxID=1987936 RepID=UPI00349F9ED9